MLKRFCGPIIDQKYNMRALCCIAFAQMSATGQLRWVEGWVDIALKLPVRPRHPGQTLRFGEGQGRGKLPGIFSGDVLESCLGALSIGLDGENGPAGVMDNC